jgi:hypothetical protein
MTPGQPKTKRSARERVERALLPAAFDVDSAFDYAARDSSFPLRLRNVIE